MNTMIQFLVQWYGVILAALLGIISMVSASGKGISKAEKNMKTDEEHYLVRYKKGGIFGALILWIAGAGIAFVIGYLGQNMKGTKLLIVVIAEAVIVIVTSIVFFIILTRISANRVWVNGEEIIIHSAFAKMQVTTFSDIRTVKKNGGETAATSTDLVIRPNGGKRFKVNGKMTNYARFALQLDQKVALPNLTKKQKKASLPEDDWKD